MSMIMGIGTPTQTLNNTMECMERGIEVLNQTNWEQNFVLRLQLLKQTRLIFFLIVLSG